MVRNAKKRAFRLVLSAYLLFGYAMPVMASACLPEAHFSSSRPSGDVCHKSGVVLQLAGSPSCEACPKTCSAKSSTIQLTSSVVKRLVHSQSVDFFFTHPDYSASRSVQSIFVPGQAEIENATLTHLRTVILLI
jgi:hypothetical protein